MRKPSTSAMAASTSAAASSTKRRSGVVKEVEKMQVMKFKREMKLFRLLFRYFNYLILINNLCTGGARQKTSRSSSDSNGAGAEGKRRLQPQLGVSADD